MPAIALPFHARFGTDAKKPRHRADYARPVPPAQRDTDGRPSTLLARWNEALVARFGNDIEHWGHVSVTRIGSDLARIDVNARVRAFPGARVVLHAVRTRWGPVADETIWTVYRGAAMRSRWIRGGERIGSVPTLEHAELLALEIAPVLPAPGSGWAFAEWAARQR